MDPIERRVTDQAYRVALEERIAELWRWRTWYRQQRNSAHWSPLRHQHTDELRALVRIARSARRIARPIAARLDPIDLAAAAAPVADFRGDHHVYPAGVAH